MGEVVSGVPLALGGSTLILGDPTSSSSSCAMVNLTGSLRALLRSSLKHNTTSHVRYVESVTIEPPSSRLEV